MKYSSDNLDRIHNDIKLGKINCIFCYGDQENIVSDFVLSLSNKLSCFLRQISYTDLIKSVNFDLILNTPSLFCSTEIIKIVDVTDPVNKKLDQYINNRQDSNLLIFVVKNSGKFAKYKFLFSNIQKCAYIAFYLPDKISTDLIINLFSPFKVCKEVIQFILSYMPSNIVLLKQEIEKIKLLAFGQDNITKQEIHKLPQYFFQSNLDDVCISLINKDYEKYFSKIKLNIRNNIPTILILRSIIRYYNNLYTVLSSKSGVKEAISLLKPPIFFKNIPNFISIASTIQLTKVTQDMKILYSAEKQLKYTGIFHNVILDKLYYDINGI